MLTILDLVKVNVALSAIEQSLGATTAQAQLIVAGYVLAFGILLVPAGRLGDQWNRKAMFVIGLSVFAAASLYSALAPTATSLVIARILQGVAAGILMPQSLGMIQNLFEGPRRGSAFGIFGAAVGVGTAFGPTLGGLFIGALGPELGWRWTFGMNVPLALIIVPIAIVLLPSRQQHSGRRDLDLVGVLLLASTVLFVMLPFVLTTGAAGDEPGRWWLLAGGAILGAGFLAWERRYAARGRLPVLDIALFRFPSYRNGVLITTLWFAVMPATFLMVTLYVQQGLGHPPVIAGMVSIPYAIVSAVVAALAGRYTYRYASGMVMWGLVIFIAGLIALAVVARVTPPEPTPWVMSIVLGVSGIGPGLIMSANQMRTLKHVPLESAGVGGSFQQVGQRLGNAMGIAVAASVFYSTVAGVGPTGSGGVTAEAIGQYRFAIDLSMLLLIGIGAVGLLVAVLDHRVDLRERRERPDRDLSE